MYQCLELFTFIFIHVYPCTQQETTISVNHNVNLTTADPLLVDIGINKSGHRNVELSKIGYSRTSLA